MKRIQASIIVLTALFGVISSEPTAKNSIFKPHCTDSNFWCQNLLTAKECNAVDYCIKAVWESHKSIASPSNVACDMCKVWVAKARTELENNDIEIIRNLESMCAYVPVKSLVDRCVDFAATDFASVIRMIESKMEPDVVCTKIFLCGNHQIDKKFAIKDASKDVKKSPMQCGQCHAVGKLVEDNLANRDDDFVLERLLGICGEMSSYSDSCSTIVMTYFDDIYAFLHRRIDSKLICEPTCKNSKKAGIVDIQPALDDPSIACTLCQEMFVHLSEVFLINTSEIEFKNVLMGFCHEMGSFNLECVVIVNNYGDGIYKFLQNTLNANKTCTAIGICKSVDGSFKMPNKPLLLDGEIFPLPKSVHEVKVDSLALEKNGTFCATCQSFVHLIHEVLEKQSFDDEILDAVKSACKKLPAKAQPECIALVDLYGDAVIALWAQNMNPNLICPTLRLCPPVLTLEYVSKTAISEKPTCVFCLMAMQDIIDYIGSNTTKSNVESALKRLCDHLSTNLIGQCQEFVHSYSAEVVDMVLSNFTPEEACVFIKICTNDKEHEEIVRIEDAPAAAPAGLVSNPQCELCKEIIKIVEQRVINKKSKDEIRRELEQSCDRLKKFNKKCKEFVDKYSDKIVDLIEQELEPEQVCHEINFCVTADRLEYQDYDFGLDVLIMAEENTENADVDEAPQCIVCEFVIAKIDEEMKNKNFTDHYKQVIKNICSKMPQTISKECNQFIDYYYDMIVDLIKFTKPSDMCADMKLCSAKVEQVTEMMQKDLYKCAICRGVVETLDTIMEDPYTDANLENLEDKLCEKFAGKYKTKCNDLVNNYGIAIINLMKTLTSSDEVCYKLEFCDISGREGTLKITDM